MNTLLLKIRDHKYYSQKYREKFIRKIVWLLPRSIVMWAFIRVVGHATTGKWSNQVVPDLKAMDALKRWDEDHGKTDADVGAKL